MVVPKDGSLIATTAVQEMILNSPHKQIQLFY